MPPHDALLDRAAGVVLGLACGDALGAGYEFGPPLPAGTRVRMKGGGSFHWAPGEWTDDTSMAVPLLQVLARGDGLDGAALDEVAAAWIDWAKSAPDVGHQTRAVCAAATRPTADALRAASAAFATRHERSAGNGSLMRTGPLALAHLDEEDALAALARRISDLTHADSLAGDACVLWTLAVARAVRTGVADLRAGLVALPGDRRARWEGMIEEAERGQPSDFPENGWAGGALQGAWSAVHHGTGLVDVLERAVRGGHDTDTVAAIAGSLAGAVYGADAVPGRWRRVVHGWPGLTADDLVDLAAAAMRHAPLVPDSAADSAPVAAGAAGVGDPLARRADVAPLQWPAGPRPETTLLQAVLLLHERGYESVRIHPSFAPTGHWRCSLRLPGAYGDRRPELFRYSNGAWWDFFDDGDATISTPDAVADRLEERLRDAGETKRASPAYRFWYAALLRHLGGERVPYLFDDWVNCEREGYLGVTGVEEPREIAFPLPPA